MVLYEGGAEMTDHDDPMPGYGKGETDAVSEESGFAVGADPEAVRT